MPFRTKNTYSTSRGTYNTRKKTFTGKGSAPAGMRKTKAPTLRASTVRTTTTARGRSPRTPTRRQQDPFATPGLSRVLHAAARARTRQAHTKIAAEKAEHRALDTLKRGMAQAPIAPLPGGKPPLSLRRIAPKAYARADRSFIAHIPEDLGEPADLENAILAVSLAGDAAAAAKLGISAGSKLLASSAAREALSKEAGNAAKTAAKRLASKTKAAPKVIAQDVKAIPERTVAKATRGYRTARRAPELATREGRRAAAKAAARSGRRHPVRAGYGAAAVSPVPLPGGLDKRARGAAVGGWRAVTQHPIETLRTTARSLPAAITGPAALGEAAALSAIHRNPKYLTKTASEQAKGLGQILGNTFSGDTKKAERAFREEGAGALLTPLPAITRLKAYERARGAAREAASAARRGAASKSEWANRNLRHAPRGSEPPVFGFAERRARRKQAALKHQRAYNTQRVSQGHHEHALANAISKAPKGSHVALQTVAEYGVRDQRGAEWLRRRGPGDRQLVKALDYMDHHPELWKSKAFADAIKAHERNVEALPAAVVGKGERARLLPQGDALGIARPGARVPHARREDLGGAKTWQDVIARTDRLKQGHAENLRFAKRQVKIATSGVAQALKTRNRLRTRLKRADKATPGLRKVALRADGAYKLARRRLDQAKQELKETVADGRRLQEVRKEAVARSQPTLKNEASYNSATLHEYAQEVEQGRSAAGLARSIYTPHSAGEKGAGLENRFPTPVGRKEHMRRGGYALEDNLDRSLEGLVRGTRAARERAGGKQFGRDLAEEKLPFKLDGETRYVVRDHKEWEQITGRKTPENPNGGQFDPKSVGRLAIREVQNAIDDPFATDAQRSATLDAILKDAEEGRTKGSAPSLLLPRELIREARSQIHPEHNPVTRTFNALARVANRTILGTNPAWALAQIPAEGIPLAMAKPSLLLKGPSIARDMVRYRRDHPEETAALEATAGAAPRSAAAAYTPLDQATPETFAKAAKALTRGKTARTAADFATLRALGKLDRGRQNAFRAALFAAEADKRFRSWHASLTGLFDRQARLSQRFKTREELWNWLAKDPRGKAEAAKIADYVDNIQGNWTAFSRYERAWAPFTIFYPFLRYSLRWTLWTFPRTHPVTATLAYMLGQANSNQLEKLIGHKPNNPLELAFPVYTTPSGEKAVLPAGSRISPGQSSLTQALATGNPAQVLSSANPFAAAGITALTGIEPLSGEKSSQARGIAALNQLLAMPAPLRLAGVKLGGHSPLGSAFAAYDQYKTVRSGLLPMTPESGARLRASERLAQKVKEKYELSSIPSVDSTKIGQEILYGGPGGTPQPQLLKRAIKELHRQERASDFVTKVEQPYYGPEKNSPQIEAVRTALREALEDAWQTGPHASSGGWRSGGSSSAAGWRAGAIGQKKGWR